MVPLWKQARDALTGVVAKSISYDKDGIDIYFLNTEHVVNGCTNQRDVASIFDQIRPHESTPTAVRLDDILRPYVDSVEEAKAAKATYPKPMVSTVNVSYTAIALNYESRSLSV